MADEILYVESRRAVRVKRMQTFQHLFAALLLATAGFSHFHHNAWLSVGEIATAAVLLASVLEEKLHQHHESRRHVASVELAGSLMSFVEAVERTRVAWSQIRGSRVNADRIDFGGGVLKLKDVVDRDRATEWLVDVLRRRGIGELPA